MSTEKKTGGAIALGRRACVAEMLIVKVSLNSAESVCRPRFPNYFLLGAPATALAIVCSAEPFWWSAVLNEELDSSVESNRWGEFSSESRGKQIAFRRFHRCTFPSNICFVCQDHRLNLLDVSFFSGSFVAIVNEQFPLIETFESDRGRW